jgi:hypothetical protein
MENPIMKSIKAALVLSAVGMLGGCIAVPVGPGYYGGPGGYYTPAPAYYGPPVYYGPSFGIGIYGGRGGYRGGFRGWR